MHPNIIFIVKCIGIPTFGTSTVSTLLNYRFITVLLKLMQVNCPKVFPNTKIIKNSSKCWVYHWLIGKSFDSY